MSSLLSLAIDTSCDETAVAVVCGREIWSNVVASQVELHKPYGGVFPTVAKQAHKERIWQTVALALKRAHVNPAEIQEVAVTVGPGLAPALEIGIAVGAALAAGWKVPLRPANHLEGHLLSVLATPRQRKHTNTSTVQNVKFNHLIHHDVHQTSNHKSSQSLHLSKTQNYRSQLISNQSQTKTWPSEVVGNQTQDHSWVPKSAKKQRKTQQQHENLNKNLNKVHSFPAKAPQSFPALGIIVSGGHTSFIKIEPSSFFPQAQAISNNTNLQNSAQANKSNKDQENENLDSNRSSEFHVVANNSQIQPISLQLSVKITQTALELTDKYLSAKVAKLLAIDPLMLDFSKIQVTPVLTNQNVLDRLPNLSLTQNDQKLWLNSGQYNFTLLGNTLDDAAGEALDKIGRMLNLGYPAGPVLEQFAKHGDAHKYELPLPLTQTKTYDLSYSGIKTHTRNLITSLGGSQGLNKQQIYDLSASVQYAVFRHICYKLNKILLDAPPEQPFAEIWLGGGVAANAQLRKMIRQTMRRAQQIRTAKTLLIKQTTQSQLGKEKASKANYLQSTQLSTVDHIALAQNMQTKQFTHSPQTKIFAVSTDTQAVQLTHSRLSIQPSQTETSMHVSNLTQNASPTTYQLKNLPSLITPYNKKLCGDNAGMVGITAF